MAVSGARKACKSWIDDSGVNLVCQEDKVLNMINADPASFAQQVHHEYAIHVPGLEPDDGAVSTYEISSQLSYFGEMKLDYTIAIKPRPLSQLLNQIAKQDDITSAYLVREGGIKSDAECRRNALELDEAIKKYFTSHGIQGHYSVTYSNGGGCMLTATLDDPDFQFVSWNWDTKIRSLFSYKKPKVDKDKLASWIQKQQGYIWHVADKDNQFWFSDYMVETLFLVPKEKTKK